MLCFRHKLFILILLNYLSEIRSGKIAIVTGANKGIGLEIARKLGSSGVKTIVACRNPSLGEIAVRELQLGGCNAEFKLLDICDSASISAFRHGHRPILNFKSKVSQLGIKYPANMITLIYWLIMLLLLSKVFLLFSCYLMVTDN